MKSRTIVYLTFGIVFLSACGCVESDQPKASNNSLRILEPEIDIGKFKSTDSITNSVTVRNGTDRPYKLQEITLSCGCLSTDFVATEMKPGEDYVFSVKIFNALLGEGTQQGEITTEPPLDEPLRFQVNYEVEPSTYLFPENFLLGTTSIHDAQWPRMVEFKVEALDNEIEISEPIRIEPAVYTFPSGLKYGVVQTERIKPGDSIRIEVSPADFPGGPFCDFFTLTISGKEQTMQFAIAVSGQVNTDPIIADAN